MSGLGVNIPRANLFADIAALKEENAALKHELKTLRTQRDMESNKTRMTPQGFKYVLVRFTETSYGLFLQRPDQDGSGLSYQQILLFNETEKDTRTSLFDNLTLMQEAVDNPEVLDFALIQALIISEGN